jgi:hypothetical protein
MQDSGYGLCVLAEAIRLVKDAYLKTKDRRIAAAALVLTELALDELDALNTQEGEALDE